jgi:hypothetical protein
VGHVTKVFSAFKGLLFSFAKLTSEFIALVQGFMSLLDISTKDNISE